MATRALCLTSAAVCFGLLGCAPGSIRLDGFPAFLGGPQSKNCDNSNPCEITVSTGSGCYNFCIDYDPVHLIRNKNDIKIVWHLPDGYVFCKSAGDGVFLKRISDDDGQFDQMYSTEKKTGDTSADKDCKKHQHYHWRGRNTVPRPNVPYGYTIIFHDVSGQYPYKLDPWIHND
jgi:hypothetical protein